MAKSYSSSAILKHLKAGTECACLAVFETCRVVQFSILVSRSTSFLFILFSRSSIKSSTNSNPKNFICESEYVALKPGLGGVL